MNILQSSTVWYGCVFWCRSNKSELFCCFRWFTLHYGRYFKINPKSMRSVSFLTKKYDSIHQRSIFWFAYCKNQVLCILIIKFMFSKVTSSYHLCVECFSQFSFDSEMYTKSAAVADFLYTSESNERCEKHSTQRW